MDTDLLLTAAAVTSMIVACTAAVENMLYSQSVPSTEQLAVMHLATGKTSCVLK